MNYLTEGVTCPVKPSTDRRVKHNPHCIVIVIITHSLVMGKGKKSRKQTWTKMYSISGGREPGSEKPSLSGMFGGKKAPSSEAIKAFEAEVATPTLSAGSTPSDLREQQVNAMKLAGDYKEMLAEIRDPKYVAARNAYEDWDSLLEWCNSNPDLVFHFRKYLLFSLDPFLYEITYQLSKGFASVKHPTPEDISNYTPSLEHVAKELEVWQKAPLAYRVFGDRHLLQAWVDEINQMPNAIRLIEDTIGLGPISTDVRPRVLELDISCEYDTRSKSPTMAFHVNVLEGFENYLDLLLQRLMEHNTEKLAKTTKKGSYWVVGTKGCTKYDFSGSDPLPDDLVTMPECDMSYFIGPKGENIKQFMRDSGITKWISPMCWPRSPQLPVIFIVPYKLFDLQREALISYIADIDSAMRPRMDDSLLWIM